VGLLSAHIFGYTNKSTLKYAHDLGLALQITNIIRDIAEDSERGRIYIPLELLKKYNISEDDVLHNKNNEQIALLIDEFSKLAKNYYQSAINHLPDEDKKMQKPGLIMGNIYFILLQKIMKGNTGNTLDNRVSLSTYKKLMIAITTSLGKTWIY
jgi:phytoene synthase